MSNSLSANVPSLLIGLVIWGSLASNAQAQAPNADQMFRGLDRNGDGSLNLQDASDNNRRMLEQILQMASKPNTGSVSRQEFQAVFEAHQRGGGRPMSQPSTSRPAAPNGTNAPAAPATALIQLCDENGDGQISRAEWSRFSQRFQNLDENGDNSLDQSELESLAIAVAPPESNRSTQPASNANSGAGRSSLEGVWRGWVVRGRGEDPNSGEMEIELTIRGDRIDGRELGTNRAPQGLGSGTFTLGASGSNFLDAVQASGPETGRRYVGVYELQGETLRWCVTARNEQRPTTMATERGNYLMILRRVPNR